MRWWTIWFAWARRRNNHGSSVSSLARVANQKRRRDFTHLCWLLCRSWHDHTRTRRWHRLAICALAYCWRCSWCTIWFKNSFENVLKHNEIEIKKQQEYLKTNEYKIYFKKFYEELPEFEYLARNREFALAKNKYGLWLIEKTGNQKAKPYFLGLTQNAFVNYDFNAPNFTFLSENAVHLSGSIVKVTRLSSFPILPKYEVIKDDVEFSIPLAEIKKDIQAQADAYSFLGSVYFELKKIEDAIQTYDKSIKLYSTQKPSSNQAYALYNLGVCYVEMKDYSKAEKITKKFLKEEVGVLNFKS